MGFFRIPQIPPVRFRWHRHPDDAGVQYEDFTLGVEGMELFRRSFSRQIDVGYQARLYIENRNGRISIRAHDQPDVTVEVVADVYATSAAEADADIERLKRAIEVEGESIRIVTPDQMRPEFGIFFFGRGPKVDYEIRVPAETEVEAVARNGPVEVAGTRRSAKAESRNGRVTAEDVASDVSVASTNGRIGVTRCAGPVRIKGGNGRISIEKVQREVEFETRNGTVDISDAGASLTGVTTNGGIRFSGRIGGDIDLRATNGSIRMSVPGDSRFEIDAESSHGSVHSDLRVKEQAPSDSAAPAPRVRLRTTNGSIRLSEL